MSSPLQSDNLVIGSMDVKASYSKCRKDRTTEIEKIVNRSNLIFDNIDKNLLSKVVSVSERKIRI